jgi:hypothetical protein
MLFKRDDRHYLAIDEACDRIADHSLVAAEQRPDVEQVDGVRDIVKKRRAAHRPAGLTMLRSELAQLVVDPELRAADVGMSHEAFLGDLVERDAVEEARLNGHAFFAGRSLGRRPGIPASSDELVEPVLGLEQHDEAIALPAYTEADAARTESHVGVLPGRLVDGDAVPAATRDDEPTLSDGKHGVPDRAPIQVANRGLRAHEVVEHGLSVTVDLLPALLNLGVSLSKQRSNAESEERSQQQRSLNEHSDYLPIANDHDGDCTTAWCAKRDRFASRGPIERRRSPTP